MKLKQLASNMTELELNNGTRVLFSYETPVAAFTDMAEHLETTTKYSKTTTKHINKWFKEFTAGGCQVDREPVDQSVLDELVSDVPQSEVK